MGRPPSLLSLCLQTAIDNIRYLGDVGETDSELLKVILVHCTPEQLRFIEDSTEGRDLSPVTDSLWLNFYERKFGEENANLVKKRMGQKGVCFKWKLLFEAKAEEQEKQQQKTLEKSLNRLKQLYAKADQEKQNKQIQICTKVPPTKGKRNYGGFGSSVDLSNVKGRLMKKAKMEFIACREARAQPTRLNRISAQSRVPLGRVSNVSKSASSMTSSEAISSNLNTASTKSPLTMTKSHVINSNMSTATAKSSSSVGVQVSELRIPW
ncbi:hypothetical protein SUGI_1051110 [Cryptomeria japonica]|nr:hypothetical protein SUGI_1051110 [Cryptomeria japonica]